MTWINPLIFLTLSVLSIALSVQKSGSNDIVLKVSTDKETNKNNQHFTGEWLKSPWGDLYQFRAGDQNWLTAREHCLSMNSDLVSIKGYDQLEWILSHYAPLSSRFAQRLIQIGLYVAEGQTHEWKWLNGETINDTLSWAAGEPYDHSMQGRERCGLLNVEKKTLDDVDCESTSADHHALRYICQRTNEKHIQQQRSNNYIWAKIENLFSFFGIGGTPKNTTDKGSNDYEDEVVKNETQAKFSDSGEETSSEEEDGVIKTLAALPKIEGSGETLSLKELSETEGSGQIVDKKVIETTGTGLEELDEKKLDKMINKMEEMIKSIDDLTIAPVDNIERTTLATIEKTTNTGDKKEVEGVKLSDNTIISDNIEDDFDAEKNKDMPKADIQPPKEDEDCDEDEDEEGSGSGLNDDNNDKDDKKVELSKEKEDHIKEFLGVLRLFLDRADHGDLRKLLDDNSGKTLLDRMKNAIREANKKEFEMLEIMEDGKKEGNDKTEGKEKKEEVEKDTKKNLMSITEQQEIYKKISSAVMKAAKEDAKVTKIEGEGKEKFDMAKKEIEKENEEKEGKIEILKSANESRPEKEKNEKVGNDDYYGDYLDDNNVVKIQNKKEKKEKKEEKENKKEDEKVKEGLDDNKVDDEEDKEKKKKEDGSITKEKKDEKEDTEKTEGNKKELKEKEEEEKVKEEDKKEQKLVEKEEKKDEEKKEKNDDGAIEKVEQKEEDQKLKTGEENDEKTTKSTIPEAEESDEVENEASGEVTTTTESTTVSVKQMSDALLEKLSKIEENQTEQPSTTTETTTVTMETTTEASTAASTETTTTTTATPTTPVTTTTPPPTTTTLSTTVQVTTTPIQTTTQKIVSVPVPTKTVTVEEMEKISKQEAKETITLLPPLPTFPTLAPFTFPTFPTPKPSPLPTFPTVKPPKIPTLEDILGNLNDQFKKLLTPPKPLPK